MKVSVRNWIILIWLWKLKKKHQCNIHTSLKFVSKIKCVTQFYVHIFMPRCVSKQKKYKLYINFSLIPHLVLDFRNKMCLREMWGGKAVASASASKPQLYSSFSQFQYEIVCESLIAFYNEFLSSTNFFSSPATRLVVIGACACVCVRRFLSLLLLFAARFLEAHNVTYWQFSLGVAF